MENFLIKSAFGYAQLASMEPGDKLKVACQTQLEYNSVKSLACQYAKSHPKATISRYSCEREKQGDGYIAIITAVR